MKKWLITNSTTISEGNQPSETFTAGEIVELPDDHLMVKRGLAVKPPRKTREQKD